MKSIAIIGAGISGLSAAKLLGNKADITVFEKARGVGGRMSTRRSETHSFDHGAPFFSVSDDRFKTFLAPFLAADEIQKWAPRRSLYDRREEQLIDAETAELYVAVPSMNSLCKALSRGQKLNLNGQVTATQFQRGKWTLFCDGKAYVKDFDWLICTAPPAQTQALLPKNILPFNLADSYHMSPCFSVMSSFESAVPLNIELAEFKNCDIQRIVANHTKPGRKPAQSTVIYSSAAWATAHLESHPNQVLDYLLQHAQQLTGIDFSKASDHKLHRWLYASASMPSSQHYLLERNVNLGLCADWLAEGTVESAFNSASALCEKLRPLL